MQTQPSKKIRAFKARSLLGDISNTTLWRWARERPDFPKPTKLSPKVTVFDLNELIAWRDKQERTAP